MLNVSLNTKKFLDKFVNKVYFAKDVYNAISRLINAHETSENGVYKYLYSI